MSGWSSVEKSANKHLRLDALAAISGVLIALQARANGELSHQLDNAPQAALVSFSSGLSPSCGLYHISFTLLSLFCGLYHISAVLLSAVLLSLS